MYYTEEIHTTKVEVNPLMTWIELWIEAKLLCPKLPAKSQFYQWLQAAWILDPQTRGGIRSAKKYTQTDLNRILKLYEFMQEHRSLKVAQGKLLEEIERNPENYFTLTEEEQNV